MALISVVCGARPAKSRSGTLMKWVYVGLGQSAIFIVAAAMIDKKHCAPILAGGVLAAVIMYGSYVHARSAGLRSDAPGTEPAA